MKFKKIFTKIIIFELFLSLLLVNNVFANPTPQIIFSKNSEEKSLTITSINSQYFYSDSASWDDANLVFIKDDISYYVINDFSISSKKSDIVSRGDKGILLVEQILIGDEIHGFSIGTYDVLWIPTGEIITTITFTNEKSSPNIDLEVNNYDNSVIITSTDSGFKYSSGSSWDNSNLAFCKNSVYFYVLNDMTLGMQGSTDLTSKNIQAGDKISGFPSGKFNVIWITTGEIINTFSFSSTDPEISFYQNEKERSLIVIKVNPSKIKWQDIEISGDANTESLGSNVKIGDKIKDCNGKIKLYYKPSGSLLDTFVFSGEVPHVSFTMDDIRGTLTVISVNPSNILWSDIEISGTCITNFLSDYVKSWDKLVNCDGKISITYTPLNLNLGSFEFSEKLYYGWLQGCVYESPGIKSVIGAKVSLYNGEKLIVSDITDIEGKYTIKAPIGNYSAYVEHSNYNPINPETPNYPGDIDISYTSTTTGIIKNVDFFLIPYYTPNYCKVYGTVYEIVNETIHPITNATVNYRIYEENSTDKIKSWNVIFTDNNGNYILSLEPGIFEFKAGKRGPSSEPIIIELKENQFILQDFYISNESMIDIFSPDRIKAIKNGYVGSEISIWLDDNDSYEHEIMIFNDVEIKDLDIIGKEVNLIISGNETLGGSTIVINVDESIIDSKFEISIEFDGEKIQKADDINDILNPNNDGLKPEYIILIGANGTQILVSIPHFSDHSISFFNVIPEVLVEYFEYAIISGLSVVFIAAVVMFRKGKED